MIDRSGDALELLVMLWSCCGGVGGLQPWGSLPSAVLLSPAPLPRVVHTAADVWVLQRWAALRIWTSGHPHVFIHLPVWLTAVSREGLNCAL